MLSELPVMLIPTSQQEKTAMTNRRVLQQLSFLLSTAMPQLPCVPSPSRYLGAGCAETLCLIHEAPATLPTLHPGS